ncbi:alkyl/aryl-sulfatase [Diplocloster hominis]|uniref:alkyl/aryl-sulfatase n=1 Tax=Diplocloster hominis TaxID=3079010 RepID=UPI0031BAE043
MCKKSGQDQLREFTERNYREQITQVTDGVWHVLGVGHSNAVFIEGESGVILIDTLDTLERGKRLLAIIKQETGKEVGTIIYTHGHPDHRGGCGAFLKSEPEIIAFAPKTPPLARTQALQDIQNLRGARQFGYALTDEENISQGIGIREGIAYGETRAFVPPATVYQEDKVNRTIDGVRLEMVRLPGETEDQIMVWLPDKEVLCCGDNYYGCWPNLYAIRGSQYRDITAWLHSLETLMSYPARYLLPGHTAPLIGEEQIQQVLGNFRGAIDYVLTQTLTGMNEGKSEDRLAAEIKLPKEYAELPYLGEFYGCVDWTVRAVFNAYLGWFDGNPTHLHPLSEKEHASKTISLMGGPRAVEKAIEEAMRDGEYQWCLELCDLLMADGEDTAGVRGRKAEALKRRAGYETSANGRHYYLTCARELENEG